ncbi:unnamed protein product, partial [Laminaria digitata]
VLPEEYETFLSYLSFVNFDIGVIVSYSCLFSPNFYGRLILISITPLVLLIILYAAYDIAKQNTSTPPSILTRYGAGICQQRYLSLSLSTPRYHPLYSTRFLVKILAETLPSRRIIVFRAPETGTQRTGYTPA